MSRAIPLTSGLSFFSEIGLIKIWLVHNLNFSPTNLIAFAMSFKFITQLTFISLVAMSRTFILAFDRVSKNSAEILGLPIIPAP